MMQKKIWIVIVLIFIGISGYPLKTISLEPSKSVVISLAGDVMMDRSVGRLIEQRGIDYPWEKVTPIFKKSDLVLVNLETSIGTKGTASPDKSYTFQSKPQTLDGLVNAGVHGVSIANNHILDFGQEGFIETLENLEQRDIKYAGGGRNLERALEPAVWNINGQRIGFLAFSRVIYDMSWYATSNRPGIVSAYDNYVEQIEKTIAESKKNIDFLIVSVHWGKEREQYPQDYQRRVGKIMIDAGADVVMGHHPHVLQGIEFYKEKPIIYSLGNFVFNSIGQLSNQTMIFNIEVGEGRIMNCYVTPIAIVNGQPNVAEEKVKMEIIDNLNLISREWRTEVLSDGQVVGNVTYFIPADINKENDALKNGTIDEDRTGDKGEKRSIESSKKMRNLSYMLGFKMDFQEEYRATMTKGKRIFHLDFSNTILTTNKRKDGVAGFFESVFVHFPARLMCQMFQWEFQLNS